ncbi:MAG: hypothetical protein ACXVZQ_12535 [Terriglobales bacterium]
MTGKSLLKRIVVTMALAAGFVMFMAALEADATPIRPDIRKIVEQPPAEAAQSVPARAGWDGPEMAAGQPGGGIFLKTELTGERLARAERAELIAAATPNPQAILGIAAVIFLLRVLRQHDERRAKVNVVAPRRLETPEEQIAA